MLWERVTTLIWFPVHQTTTPVLLKRLGVCVCVLAQQCDTHTLTQLTDEKCPERSLLMIVLDVHVDDVHRLERLLFTGVQVCRVNTHTPHL